MMADQSDGPPSNKRPKMGGMGPNDGDYNFSALSDLPDGLLGNNMPPNNGMMSHQQQMPIHERHQNLTALLTTNTNNKDGNHPGSMGNTMVNNYSGPGPGHAGNNPYVGPGGGGGMMANGPSSANYQSSGYTSSYNNSMMYSQSVPSSGSYSVSNTMPQQGMSMSSQQQHNMGMNNMPPHANMASGQHMQQQPQQPPGMGPIMNGPGGPMGSRPPMANNGTMHPRLQNPSQGMPNGPMSHPGNGSMVNPNQGGPPPGPQMGGPRAPGPINQPAAGPTAIHAKRKQLQQQLVLLLHAHKCQRRERSNGEIGGEAPCNLMHCRTMKGVLQHMTVCTEGKQCQVAHCVSSRQIIAHWRSCSRNDCPVCLPLKTASERKNSNNMLNNLVASSQPGGANPMGVNGMDLPVPGPAPGAQGGPGMGGLNQPQNQMSNQNMGGAGSQGNMLPPSWPGQNQPGMPGGPMNQPPGGAGVMPTQQGKPPVGPGGPNGPLPPNAPPQMQPNNQGAPNLPSMGGGMPSGGPGSASGGNVPISAPEMKKAYDALGLTYPGVGGGMGPQHLASPQGQRPTGMGGITSMNNDQPAKEWHKNVALDLRNHLVHKLVQAIFPSPQPEVLSDPRMTNLIHYARKVEMEMYKTANSREEYYHMLAEKIYKIQKELEEKRRTRRQQISQQSANQGQQPPPPQGGVGVPNSSAGPNSVPSGPNSAAGSQTPGNNQNNMLGPASNLSNYNGPGSVPPSSVPSVSGGPGSVPSYGGPPSVGPHSVGASLMSPPMSGTASGVPVSTALMESKNELQEAIRKQQMQHEIKPEIKSEPRDSMDISENGDVMKKDGFKADSVKDEPKAPNSAPQTPKSESKTDVKDLKPATPSSNQPKVPKKTWKADELQQAFSPTLEKLLILEESLPFRQPVDAISLGIPDYYDIIKDPIDLQTIKNKLDDGSYTDPWQYCDDIWLMFENAWAYNRKTSRVYKWCSRLAEVFEGDIDAVMQKLGFCCGRKYVFSPQSLCCYGKQLCTINRDQVYYSYENRYVYCEKCFEEIQTELVELADEITGNPITLPKSQFIKTKNDHLELEKFSICTDCGRKVHNICVSHMDAIWPQGFTCESCLKTKGAKRKENRFTAKRLPTCKLSAYLESRVNNFLTRKSIGAGEVIIRVLASGDKDTEMKMAMKERFPALPATYPYRTKAMFAFEEIDGQEVCFFGMHVQEYDDKVCQPNRGRVYISYLDSVHFFQPKEYKTAVYHEILIGYLDYCKALGFNWAHIWACPPSEGDDYIFHCHPVEQKIPKPKRLQDWYKKMLDKAIIEGVVVEYKDIYKDAVEKGLSCATQVPYFEGDFWPNVLEESIRELEEEEKRKRAEEEAAAAQDAAAASQDADSDMMGADTEDNTSQDPSGKKQGKKATKKKGNKKASTRKSSKKPAQQNGSDLTTKVLSSMEKYRDVFFVIKLQTHALIRQDVVSDPDPLISCDLMDGRDAFLTMAREKHWEFSTLRRTKFSTIAMLHEIHNSSRDAFVYTCNMCKGQVETRWHCTVCEDFDLCVQCYQKEKHQHPMEKLGLLDGDGNQDSAAMCSPAESRKISIQRCIQSLVHACQCRDANCRQSSCQKMKKVVHHTKSCRKKSLGGCAICKQLVTLCCFHAKNCNEGKCPVPFCLNIKQKFKQQQANNRKKQAAMLRRRMAAMIGGPGGQGAMGSTPPSGNTSGSKLPHSNSQSSLGQPVSSPYPASGNHGGGKPMQPAAPPAAVHAAHHALNQALKATQGPPSVGGKPMPGQHPGQPVGPGGMGGKPAAMAQQRGMNPAAVSAGMMHQAPNQNMSMQSTPNQMGQPGGYGQQPMGGMRDQGMPPGHGGQQPPMMMPNSMGGHPQQDQWVNPQPPPPMYNQSRPMGHHPGMGAGGMMPRGPGQPGMGPPSANANLMRQLEIALKSPNSAQQHQEIMELLKSNPQLMDAFIKRKNQNHMQRGAAGGMSWPMGRRPPGPHSMGPNQMQPNMYPQQPPQNQGYQMQSMMQHGMPPQYGGPRVPYQGSPAPDGSMPGQPGGPPMGHQPGGVRIRGQVPPGAQMHHNHQLLQQVRSPAPLPSHTRSPQPGQSPRPHATASPAIMQPGMDPNPHNMVGMMQPGTPGQGNYAPQMNTNMPPQQQNAPPDFGGDQGFVGSGPQGPPQPDSSALTPQEELSKFVDSL